jgi:dihydrofolate reductase
VSKLRVLSFAISIDGFGAGPHQDLENPLGVGGLELMQWLFHSRAWGKMHGKDGGETGVDNAMAEQGFDGIGAWILGRNMFGPVRGPWPDESWPAARSFALSRQGFTPHWQRRPLQRKAATCASAVASRPSGSTCAPG